MSADGDQHNISVHGVVVTARAARYLTQLREHLDQLRAHQMPHGAGAPTAVGVRHVERTGAEACITLTTGRIQFTATDDKLSICVNADDENSAHNLQTLITHRIHTIGRREQLTVDWTTSPPA